jgi:hypothetical protein
MNRSHLKQHLNTHLSDDELIQLLYGLGDAEDHLACCAECGERWSEMQRALGRNRAESATEVSGRRLAVQRQQVLDRLERPLSGSHAWRWVPAAAAAALLAVSVFLSQSPFRSRVPAQAPAASVNPEADAALFTDVYSMEQDVEPRAAAPIRALFQEASFEPAAPAEEPQKQ